MSDEVSIPMHVPNVLGYFRFILIAAAWPFGMTDANTFLALHGTAHILGVLATPLGKLLGQ